MARVNQVIQEEAQHARVAASFLPLYGPLPAGTDFVRSENIVYRPRMMIVDTDTIKLSTLQVRVNVRGAQLADPEMTSALALFRRAANVVARLEDALIFNGQRDTGALPERAPDGAEIKGGQPSAGLLIDPNAQNRRPGNLTTEQTVEVAADGDSLVVGLTESIGGLEEKGHFGPFAVVLAQDLFVAAHKPEEGVSVLPRDRMLPLLAGGSLLRSSLLRGGCGVVVALGGAPIELVVASDMSLQFLQVTEDSEFVFRVYEKAVLRITDRDAIVALIRRPREKRVKEA
jgi:uncharacterized linocin/CFP29 family protein